MIQVSVIIPYYNSHIFIDECVNSVLDQTMKDLEILIINDGSDNSEKDILDNLSERDDRVKIININHSGPGLARNIGIKKSVGKYVAFIDSDDYWLEADALTRLVTAADSNNIKICGAERCTLTNTGELVFNPKFERVIESGTLIKYRDFQECYDYQNYIFNREFLISNEIFFPDYLRYQDPPFFVRAMHTAGSFYALPIKFYCYRFGHQDRNLIESRINWILKGIRDVLTIAVDNGYEKLIEHVVENQLNNEYYHMIYGNLTDDNTLLIYQIKVLLGDKYHVRVTEKIRSVKNTEDNLIATREKLIKIENSQNLLRTLLKKKNQGWTLSDCLIKNYGKRIIIYGAGYWGNIVYEEIKGSDVTIVGVLDKNISSRIDGLHTYGLDEAIPEYDIIIVALINPIEAVTELIQRLRQPIVSIESLLSAD